MYSTPLRTEPSSRLCPSGRTPPHCATPSCNSEGCSTHRGCIPGDPGGWKKGAKSGVSTPCRLEGPANVGGCGGRGTGAEDPAAGKMIERPRSARPGQGMCSPGGTLPTGLGLRSPGGAGESKGEAGPTGTRRSVGAREGGLFLRTWGKLGGEGRAWGKVRRRSEEKRREGCWKTREAAVYEAKRSSGRDKGGSGSCPPVRPCPSGADGKESPDPSREQRGRPVPHLSPPSSSPRPRADPAAGASATRSCRGKEFPRWQAVKGWGGGHGARRGKQRGRPQRQGHA